MKLGLYATQLVKQSVELQLNLTEEREIKQNVKTIKCVTVTPPMRAILCGCLYLSHKDHRRNEPQMF
jgi:hypothetical protein